MKIGIPKEVKEKENRVACTPGSIRALTARGHAVFVEKTAGEGSGFSDKDFADAGATLLNTAGEVWKAADMIIKVKEPQPEEFQFLRPGLVLFTYLHLAAEPALTDALLASKTVGIAYETVQVGNRLPLLEPMSEIAGRMSAIVGANYLSKVNGGAGVLLGGVPGVAPARVVVVGGGTAGVNAARMAAGMGADVAILEVDTEKMRYLDTVFAGRIKTIYSNEQNLMDLLPRTDLLIGAVLVPGAKAPKLIRREMLRSMRPGSVFVDIAIDQGGCAETSRPTSHLNPVFVDEGVVHYCVTNMPGAYARTSAQALVNATTPYALKLADLGWEAAVAKFPEIGLGLNTADGKITYAKVSEALGK